MIKGLLILTVLILCVMIYNKLRIRIAQTKVNNSKITKKVDNIEKKIYKK